MGVETLLIKSLTAYKITSPAQKVYKILRAGFCVLKLPEIFDPQGLV